MKQLILVAGLSMAAASNVFSQSTQTSGNWNDPTIWSGGAVPAAGGTVNVNNPVVIDGSLSPTGALTFAGNATDVPGGTAYTFNPNAGSNTIKIDSNEIVSFEGGTSGTPNAFSSGTIDIFGTLILGYTQLSNSSSLKIIIEPSGTLIINGDLINKNNAGTFTVNGALIVNGNFDNQTGSVTVGGSGTINTTGTITTTGGSTVFGSTNDCNTGPCSGSTLTCSFTNAITPVGKTICSGSTAGTLTSNYTGASSPTFQWYSSTDNITYGNASGTSTNSTYITPALTQTTWYKVKVTSSSGCNSTSGAVMITVFSSGGWLGGTSNDWATASNWCGLSVPTSTTDVTITNGTGITYMPTIKSGTTASSRNLTISNTYPASSLTISTPTASLSIYGNLTNNGTLTDSSITSTTGVLLLGSTLQTISGSSGTTLNDLTINNSSGASPGISISSNNLSVSKNLTMTSGIINLNGTTFTLGTAATDTGKLIYSSGRMYGGNLMRWFSKNPVLQGSNASLFPIGTVSDYRPIYFSDSSGISSGGTIRASHTDVNAATAVSFPDGSFTVQVRTNSYWTVTSSNGLSGTGNPFSIRTEATGLGLVGSVSDLRLTLAASAAPGTAGTNANTITNPQVNRYGIAVASLSNTYYWGSVNPGNTTLPVELLSFTGQQQGAQVALQWQTGTDENDRSFSVERSADGASFVEIDFVPVAVNSLSGHSYGFADQHPVYGKNYYRLKIVGLDGSYSYSRIISVYITEGSRFVIFPNPSDGNSITVQTATSPQASCSIDVFNDLGVLVGHAKVTSLVSPVLFTPSLTPGVYFVRYVSGGQATVRSFAVRR
jgi:hypothetical protein